MLAKDCPEQSCASSGCVNGIIERRLYANRNGHAQRKQQEQTATGQSETSQPKPGEQAYRENCFDKGRQHPNGLDKWMGQKPIKLRCIGDKVRPITPRYTRRPWFSPETETVRNCR